MINENRNGENKPLLEKPEPYLYADFHHKVRRGLRFFGEAMMQKYPRYPDDAFTLSESEREAIRNDTEHAYISISINREDFRRPIPFKRDNHLYQNVVSYIDHTFGYKTGRVLDLIQYYYAYKENVELRFNVSTDYPEVAFLMADFTDADEYRKWYHKYGKDLKAEEIITQYPLLK